MLDQYKIGNQIALLRKEKGFTGEKFAEQLNVTAQAVSKWENGKCLPETALLPVIAKLLGVSIDSILVPNELLILSATYTDGVKEYELTQVLNNYIHGNNFSITVNASYLGISPDTQRLYVLTIKYQTPSGTYYRYAMHGENIQIDLSSKGYELKPFELLDAYYGNRKEYRSAMQKMQHYDYFKWNQIHVNHENFPSLPSSDDTEYLTMIYLNKNGIHVISCEENEVLCFTEDKTELYIRDLSTCQLPGIMTLDWEQNMDCTWAGALYAALKYMEEPYTYEDIMGISGACYRIAFTPYWDWSAVDALVAFDYSKSLYKAIGYEPVWAARVEKEDRNIERKRIVDDILSGKPMVAINLRIAPEWGVITGYKENGKVLLCRTYFDREILNEQKDYLESDFWPFLITHFGEKIEKTSDCDSFHQSLTTLIESFEAKSVRGYFQGKEAYEKWIEGLKDDSLWDMSSSKEDVIRRMQVNDCMLLNLIDARRSAAIYLKKNAYILQDSIEDMNINHENIILLTNITERYDEIVNLLLAFREKLKTSDGEGFTYNVVESKGIENNMYRKEQIEILEKVLLYEEEIRDYVKQILNC